jgi:hypothetical protein
MKHSTNPMSQIRTASQQFYSSTPKNIENIPAIQNPPGRLSITIQFDKLYEILREFDFIPA